MTQPPPPAPDRHFLTPAEQHELFNEPADPPMQRYDGLIWVALMGISAAGVVAITVWIYNAIFN